MDNKSKIIQKCVMFVDMIGSTRLKYEEGEDVAADLCYKLFQLIRDLTKSKSENISFTGDGAMVVFGKNSENGSMHALDASEKLLQAIDRENLRYEKPRLMIRVGIATGTCYVISDFKGPEVSGRTPDLASRLCSEADEDGVLVDLETMEQSKLPPHRFSLCKRRLTLKGVPIPHENKRDKYYHFKCFRFLANHGEREYSKGLLSLYSDRISLDRNITPARLVRLAWKDSTIFVAGRTLISWSKITKEMQFCVKQKNLKFQLLILKSEAVKYLDKNQQKDIANHLPIARERFLYLMLHDPAHFDIRQTEQLILDGVTCVTIAMPGQDQKNDSGTLITIQDINVGNNKAALVMAAPYGDDGNPKKETLACGVCDRTKLIFDKSEKLSIEKPHKPESILQQHSEGMKSRNNSPLMYVSSLSKYFSPIKANNLSMIPAPQCVQIQVTTKCSTHCVMCQHHDERRDELKANEWAEFFCKIRKFGVKTLIISGGEPLEKNDLSDILDKAYDNGNENRLRIGLQTNGSMSENNENKRTAVIRKIAYYVDWIAISVDGTENEDSVIRKTQNSKRMERLREFCKKVRGFNDKIVLSVTLTIQQHNYNIDLEKFISFIKDSKEGLGIPQVNFKFATGSQDIVNNSNDYVISEDQANMFVDILWNNYLVDQSGNNLDYLRRCFAEEVFKEKDVSQGAPVLSFYKKKKLRCFTPFLFSLVDCNGDVYPCCHLYRDNHGKEGRTQSYRDYHKLGNIRKSSFINIWQGTNEEDTNGNYIKLRDKLKEINPDDINYIPCGECTRHCQHNWAISKLYEYYKNNVGEFETYAEKVISKGKYFWF